MDLSRGVNSDKWLKTYLLLTFSLSYWNNLLDIGIELDPYRDEFAKNIGYVLVA